MRDDKYDLKKFKNKKNNKIRRLTIVSVIASRHISAIKGTTSKEFKPD
jgi:hypothetical protein